MLLLVECITAGPRQGMAAASYKHYVACFRSTLAAMLSLYDTPCQACPTSREHVMLLYTFFLLAARKSNSTTRSTWSATLSQR